MNFFPCLSLAALAGVLFFSLTPSESAAVAGPNDQRTSPVVWLDTTTVDVGDIPRAEDHTHVFAFRNLTDEPLLIQNVREGCGCTASDWLEEPTMPGDTGKVTVTYDAAVAGYFRKSVKVFFHGYRGGHKLYLEGYVEP